MNAISSRRRMEARRQHQPRSIGQQPVVLAVLVHDRQALGAAVARAGGRDIDDPRVEIALLAQQPLVDHVGHDVRDAPPVALGGGVGGALDLGLRQDVPQAELHAHLTAAGSARCRSPAPARRSASSSGNSARRESGPAWMNAAWSISRNSPLRARSALMTPAILAKLGGRAVGTTRSGIAIGIGAVRARLTSITADARRRRTPAATPAGPARE